MAARVRARDATPFSLIEKLGADCVGAAQFVAGDAMAPPAPGTQGDLTPLTDSQIAARLRGLKRRPLGLETGGAFRLSLAGAQEKTALHKRAGQWGEPAGTTPTTHILKPQIGPLQMTTGQADFSQSVENEFFCLRYLHHLGLPVAAAEMVDFEDVRVLSVTRFDRQWDAAGHLHRLPQEDMCQALAVPAALKYQSDGGPGIAAILGLLRDRTLFADPRDALVFALAQVQFWLLGATVGHGKNFSLHHRPGGRGQLAPLYDVLSIEPAMATGTLAWKEARLAMAVGQRRQTRLDKIKPQHFAQSLGQDLAEMALSHAHARSEAALAATYQDLPAPFPAAIADPIAKGVQKRRAMLNP